jgi:hypothetical protein
MIGRRRKRNVRRLTVAMPLQQHESGDGLSSHEVASRAGCAERYVREWLNSQVAGTGLCMRAVNPLLRAKLFA